MMPLSSPPANLSRRAGLGWLIAILGLSLVLRLALVPGRWINPDEGAHLMDGRLALDGLLPYIDFDSRQIAYTYVLAELLRLTNDGYLGVRLCLGTLTVANIYLVYLIARRLFDEHVGVAAAVLYAVQPLAVIWAPIVHTEPVVIFPTCLAIYCLVRHFQQPGNRIALVLAGVFLSLAYYVRESSLGVTAAVAVVLAAESWRAPQVLLRRYGLFLLGFLIPCTALTLFYASHLTPRIWWTSPLNPLFILLEQLPALGPGPTTAAGTPMGGPTTYYTKQAWDVTAAYLQSVAVLCAGLLAGLAASLGLGPGRLGGARWRAGQPRADILLYAWLGGLAAVYGFWSLRRGFFPQYSEEFLPALSIVLGAVVADLLRLSLPRARLGLAVGLLAVYMVAAFAASRFSENSVSAYAFFLVPALGLGLAQLASEGRVRAWGLLAGGVALLLLLASPALGTPVGMRRALTLAMIPAVLGGMYLAVRQDQRLRPRFLALCAGIALATVLGWSFGRAGSVIGRAGSVIDLAYQSVWPPETVRTVSAFIRQHSSAGDRVMSGAVIWDLEAGRRPFANVSHPLSFMLEASAGTPERLARELRTAPPRFVVLDGYTERTYGRVLPGLQDALAARYQLVLDLPGVHYPVRVYRLREPGSPS